MGGESVPTPPTCRSARRCGCCSLFDDVRAGWPTAARPPTWPSVCCADQAGGTYPPEPSRQRPPEQNSSSSAASLPPADPRARSAGELPSSGISSKNRESGIAAGRGAARARGRRTCPPPPRRSAPACRTPRASRRQIDSVHARLHAAERAWRCRGRTLSLVRAGVTHASVTSSGIPCFGRPAVGERCLVRIVADFIARQQAVDRLRHRAPPGHQRLEQLQVGTRRRSRRW